MFVIIIISGPVKADETLQMGVKPLTNLQYLVPTARDRLAQGLQRSWQGLDLHQGQKKRAHMRLMKLRHLPAVCEELMAACNKADASDRATALSTLISTASSGDTNNEALLKVDCHKDEQLQH